MESGQATDRHSASTTGPSESRPTINYISGGSSDDQYQSKRRQKKLLRVAIVKVKVNVVHTERKHEETKPSTDRSWQCDKLVATTCLQVDEDVLRCGELNRANPLWF